MRKLLGSNPSLTIFHSSVGQSVRLLTERSAVRARLEENYKTNVRMPEWSKGSRLGRDVEKRVGSNPTADKSYLVRVV